MENRAMSKKYEEYLQVQLPKGTKEKLAELAARKYDTAAGLARKAIMAVLDKERQAAA
jgi:predicted transcriptional regulator